MQRADERREFQRLNLNPPIPGTLGTTAVSILEVGVLGARMQHTDALDVTRGDLRFSYKDADIDMRCDIVRTLPQDGGYESGVRFIAAVGESGDRLREMLAELVTEELTRRRDISAKDLGTAIDGDRTVRGKDAAYLCFRFENKTWSKRRIFIPEQPPVGFTVARTADTDEMQRLCAVYEASDEEGRRLIRLFAELSVSDAMQIPPRAV